jgi:4-hydroxy-4-methyl-2-oxoglutarate aldolase
MAPTPSFPSGVARIPDAEMAIWRTLRTAAICDELKHTGGPIPRHIGVVDPVLRNITPDVRFAGQAMTLKTSPGSGIATKMLDSVWPGVVIMVDARAQAYTTVFGGNMIVTAAARGVVGVVVDGLVRDVVEIKASGVGMFCRDIIPAGDAYGGTLNVPIMCGGVLVNPGDLIVGDEDGVVVVSPEHQIGLMAKVQARMKLDQGIQAAAAKAPG